MALTQTPAPSDLKGVPQFMGLASYFRRFIKDFATLPDPITASLRKNQTFEWTMQCESARQMVIAKLSSSPILRIYNPELECQLHTDASSMGSATLLQEENGVVRTLAAELQTVNQSYDLETLAIVEAVEHFRVYLYGRHFTALKRNLHPRVARWWIKLQDYDFSVEYRPGQKMAHGDYLSRNPFDLKAT